MVLIPLRKKKCTLCAVMLPKAWPHNVIALGNSSTIRKVPEWLSLCSKAVLLPTNSKQLSPSTASDLGSGDTFPLQSPYVSQHSGPVLVLGWENIHLSTLDVITQSFCFSYIKDRWENLQNLKEPIISEQPANIQEHRKRPSFEEREALEPCV